MARSRRVRQLATEELITELANALIDVQVLDELPAHLLARWSRVARELARRDYRFRPHGQRCECSDCWMLWGTWSDLRRRSEPDITRYLP